MVPYLYEYRVCDGWAGVSSCDFVDACFDVAALEGAGNGGFRIA